MDLTLGEHPRTLLSITAEARISGLHRDTVAAMVRRVATIGKETWNMHIDIGRNRCIRSHRMISHTGSTHMHSTIQRCNPLERINLSRWLGSVQLRTFLLLILLFMFTIFGFNVRCSVVICRCSVVSVRSSMVDYRCPVFDFDVQLSTADLPFSIVGFLFDVRWLSTFEFRC